MKSPAYPPLDSLFDLACRQGVDIRPTLLRVTTDLYVQKPVHSAEEETQYVELAMGLVPAVDEATRAAVAATLSHYPNAPAALLRKLGAPALERTTEQQARDHRDDLTDAFFAADADERRLILTTLDAVIEPGARVPMPATGDAAKRLETAALQRNVAEFGRILESALGVSPTIAQRITHDAGGEPIVVAAKAVGMKAAALQRALLFVNTAIGQSVQRVYTLAQLFDDITPAAALQMVAIWQGSVKKPNPAQKPAQRPAHQPMHWDDERRSARGAATPGQYRTGRRSDEHGSRVTKATR